VAPSLGSGLSTPTVAGQSADTTPAKRFYQQWWFWAILGTTSVVTIGGITYYYRATEDGQRQWAKLRKMGRS
jgi:hypothetical protein